MSNCCGKGCFDCVLNDEVNKVPEYNFEDSDEEE